MGFINALRNNGILEKEYREGCRQPVGSIAVQNKAQKAAKQIP
jgi:hypothetical protein